MVTGTLVAIERPLDEINEPLFLLLRDYWREAAAGRRCLPIKELRPERFARALEHTGLVERTETPRQGLRIRLCGGDMENKDFGIVRGAYLEDAQPEWYRDHLVGEITRAMGRAEPIHQSVKAEINNDTFQFARLMLPLTGGTGDCDVLLIATVRPSSTLVTAMRARLTLA